MLASTAVGAAETTGGDGKPDPDTHPPITETFIQCLIVCAFVYEHPDNSLGESEQLNI